MTILETSLAGLTVGTPVTHGNLTMFPLLGGTAGEPGYLTLGEALAAGQAHVTEVSEQGSVPELKFVNGAARPVLLLDGEELVGAKQNRIVNLSILVAAASELVIPVSCVEAGRWRHDSAVFATAERAHFASGRARKLADVSCSLADNGSRRSDQGAVWEEISAKASRMQTESNTAAAAAMYEANAKRLDDFVQAMPPAAQQCGAAFAINGRLVGLDLFDARATFAKQAKTLVTSYALDAIDESANDAPAMQDAECRALLSDVLRADCRVFKAIGLGEDLRLGGEGIRGAALAVEGRLVHLCAFREEAGDARGGNGAGSRMVRASGRRRLH
jgi:hypothetical protein